MVLVLVCGSALSITWAAENVRAIIHSWYGGEEGGIAIAEAIFGDYSPRGGTGARRIPSTRSIWSTWSVRLLSGWPDLCPFPTRH